LIKAPEPQPTPIVITDSRHEYGLPTGVITVLQDTEPVITDTKTVITDLQNTETVITDAKTVITPQLTVITRNQFDYGDKLMSKTKQEFQTEIANIKTGNGDLYSILDRIDSKKRKLDTIIQDRRVAISPQKLREMDDFLLELNAIVDKFKAPQLDLFSPQEWTIPKYNKAA
jgi:hypothetical protein